MDNLPFMPEMLEFFGQTVRVGARLERACDTLTWTGVRRFENTVVLDDLRCTGAAHEGCGAGCLLFWREAWLRPAADVSASAASSSADETALARLAELSQRATTRPGAAGDKIFRCQATQLLAASAPVRWWSPASIFRELSSGNVGPVQFVRVIAGAVVDQVKKRLFRERPAAKHGRKAPVLESPQTIQPGDLVRVRSREEIAATLDPTGKLRGLHFDFPEMAPFCGQEAPVLARIDRFIDENSGKMVQLRTDAIVLEGCACSGHHAAKRWFCPRAVYPWWREDWLEPVTEDQSDHVGTS